MIGQIGQPTSAYPALHFPLSYPMSSLWPLTDTLFTLILGRSRTALPFFLLGLEFVKAWADGKAVGMENSQDRQPFLLCELVPWEAGMARQGTAYSLL